MGHWRVQEDNRTVRKTALRKIRAVIFVCLASKVFHIEPLMPIDSSFFINVFKRFVASRDPCKQLQSHRGTNLVGIYSQSVLQNETLKKKSPSEAGCEWIFNPPHSSHFGSWERKIGFIRRSLDFSLLQMGSRHIKKDELHSLLLEATSIVNSRCYGQLATQLTAHSSHDNHAWG